MQPNRSFRPLPAATVTVSVGTSSAATALPAKTDQYRLYNSGSVPVFFDFGASGTSATIANSTPIAAGATEVFTALPGVTHIATIASAASTLFVTPGEGI